MENNSVYFGTAGASHYLIYILKERNATELGERGTLIEVDCLVLKTVLYEGSLRQCGIRVLTEPIGLNRIGAFLSGLIALLLEKALAVFSALIS